MGIQTRGVPLAERIAAPPGRHRGRRGARRGAGRDAVPRRHRSAHARRRVAGSGRCPRPASRPTSTAAWWCSSTTCCSPAARSAPRWTPCCRWAAPPRSGWWCWSTAATGSCRSGPTTSARTCPPRWPSTSPSTSPRWTATTACWWTTATPDPSSDTTTEVRVMQPLRNLISIEDLDAEQLDRHPRHRRADARGGRAPHQEGPGPARPDRLQPVPRGLHPHPHLASTSPPSACRPTSSTSRARARRSPRASRSRTPP